MTEAAFDRFLERWKTDLFGLDGDRPGLDFGEIEDIIDEIEQIVSGRVDVAGNSICLGCRLPAVFSASS